jgi:hypothetical protein
MAQPEEATIATAQREDATIGSSARRPDWVVPLGFAVVAFIFRLFLGKENTQLGGDAREYTALAKNLAAGHGYSFAHTAPYLASDLRVPAYPAILAVAFAVSDSHWSVIVLNSLLGAITTYLVWLIADGLHLTRKRALWCTGIAAFWLPTASLAGIALSENLSVTSVLAMVYFVLIRPPRTRLRLFIFGSALAWVVALTRDELVFFVFIVAIAAGRRAHLRVLGTAALALCFLLGSFAWVGRNEVQVHRTEYVDSVMSDAVLVASINGSLHTKLYKKAYRLVAQPTISNSQRSEYQHQVYKYLKFQLSHHLSAVAKDHAKYGLESFFPVPIFGLTYTGQSKLAIRLLWSILILVEYLFAAVTAWRWWKNDRRTDVVSILLFPVFIVIFEMIFDPQFRFLLPVNLLVLPLTIEFIGHFLAEQRSFKARTSAKPSGGTGTPQVSDLLGSGTS